MAGTKLGGLAAAATNKRIHGNDFYARIGAIGGSRSNTGGFAADVSCKCSTIAGPHLVRNCAGAKGGKKSRRRKSNG